MTKRDLANRPTSFDEMAGGVCVSSEMLGRANCVGLNPAEYKGSQL